MQKYMGLAKTPKYYIFEEILQFELKNVPNSKENIKIYKKIQYLSVT